MTVRFDPAWVTAIVGATLALAAFIKWVWPILRKMGEFLDDWRGEEERPGYERRPGMPERVARIEADQQRIRHELTTNGGGSMKDAVRTLVKDLADLRQEVRDYKDRQPNQQPNQQPPTSG